MSAAPARLAGRHRSKGRLSAGYDADIVVWDPDAPFTVAADALYYRHPISPYVGAALRGRVHRTFVRGHEVYDGDGHPAGPIGPRPAASGGRVSETAATAAAFTGLIDLAALGLGGQVLGASDDFFASANNLIEPGRGVFIEGKFTDRGKWMDGWESRRKRVPGYDWCVLELGAPGTVVGFDVDTHFFVGNSPAFASIEGVHAPRGTPLAALQAMRVDRAAAADAGPARRAEPVRGDAGRAGHARAPEHLPRRRRGALPRLRPGRRRLVGAGARSRDARARHRRQRRSRGGEPTAGSPSPAPTPSSAR